jgi:pimeloyl-ACP methyl ester carboxylesterase
MAWARTRAGTVPDPAALRALVVWRPWRWADAPGRHRRPAPRRAVLLVLLVVVIVLSGCSSAAPGPVEAGTPDFAGPVDIGGRRIFLQCRGPQQPGRPVIVLGYGLGGSGELWNVVEPGLDPPAEPVLPALARTERVCTYDRPNTLLPDQTYPEQVAGLVLVDATSEKVQNLFPPAFVQAMDQAGPPLPGLEYVQPLTASFDQVIAAASAHPLRPDLPLTVISAGLLDQLPTGPERPALETAVRGSQDYLAHLLPGTRQVIAANSGHNIMFTEPGVVVDAVDTQLCQITGSGDCAPAPTPAPFPFPGPG